MSVCKSTVIGLAVVACFLVAATQVVQAQDGNKCQMSGANPYPPTEANMSIPVYEIDLDLPAKQRWNHVIADFKDDMISMIDTVINLKGKLVQDLLKLLDGQMDEYLDRIPAGFGDEMRGISEASGVNVAAIFIYNVFYEVEGMCTSIVGQDKNGNVMHGRNLDFGLFSKWDTKNDTWLLTERLRPIIFNAKWMKGGKELYTTTQYAGYIGAHTGQRAGSLSISVDSRFDDNLDKYLLEWLFNKYQASFLTFTTREVLETCTSYDQAMTLLQKREMVGPSYIIMGGTEPGQGAVITYAPGQVGPLNTWTLQTQLEAGSFYVLETNYDHWKPAPFFDNRRGPAEDCLNHTVTQEGFTKPNLFWVLSSVPNLNKLTTFTALMNAKQGHYEAYKQRCWDDKICALW